jgi:hypothetical protein
MEFDKGGDASSHSFAPLLVPGGLSLLESEKAETLADSLESQFRPVNDPSDAAVIEIVNEAIHAHEYAPASELNLTSPSNVLHAIRGHPVLNMLSNRISGKNKARS